MQIITDRLILNAASVASLKHELAFLKDAHARADLAHALGATIISWPPLYHDEITCAWGLEKLTANPERLGWGQWHVLLKQSQAAPILVASAGFHGPPDGEGNVEIGYSVIEPFQRQGIATETVAALTKWAFSHHEVNKSTITTLDTPELLPSAKVAQRSGFHLIGKKESDEGTILIYELTREEYVTARSADSGR